MMALEGVLSRTRPLIERLDALSLRERAIIFMAGVAFLFVAWQALLMDPLSVRTRAAEQRLAAARHQLENLDTLGAAAAQDPAVAAALRNRALKERLDALDRELASAAQGYISPQRMNELLRALLEEQKGLKLVSLVNRPVESLSRPAPSADRTASAEGKTADHNTADHNVAAAPDADDRGPFLHPVEIVVEGDYASVAQYLRALESLPWRIHWRTVELTALDYPVNRVRIEIGALSLSRHWMSV